jgi:hypothetical protein
MMKPRLYGTFGSLLVVVWGFRLRGQGDKKFTAALLGVIVRNAASFAGGSFDKQLLFM